MTSMHSRMIAGRHTGAYDGELPERRTVYRQIRSQTAIGKNDR